jgi:DNA ligase-1
MVGNVLSAQPSQGQSLTWIAERFALLADTPDSGTRREIVRGTLAVLGASEARYFAKLIGGELRIGLKEAQVEEAIARAFNQQLDPVRHVNLLRGDIGEVAILTRHDRLSIATLWLFHPIGLMLAQPVADA